MIEIDNLIKDALKNKQTVELKVYRNLKADIMAFKTQKNAPEYNDASEIYYYCRVTDGLAEETVNFIIYAIDDEYEFGDAVELPLAMVESGKTITYIKVHNWIP